MKKIIFILLSALLLVSCDYTTYEADTTKAIPEEDVEEYRDYVKELMEAAHPGHYTAGKGKHLDDVVYGIETIAKRTYEKEVNVLKYLDGYWNYVPINELDSSKLEIYNYVLKYGPIKIRDKYPQEVKYKFPYKGQRPQ